jgi:hypothetical protein
MSAPVTVSEIDREVRAVRTEIATQSKEYVI